MSVLACSRHCCTNIMCDKYSPNYGYICNECFEELVQSGVDTNIREFMDSDKTQDTNRSYDAIARYSSEFKFD